MNRSVVEAMSRLEQASPIEGTLSWWTLSDEDALLATVFADSDATEYGPNSDLTNRPARPKRMRVAIIGLCVIAVGSVALVVDLIGSGSPSAFAAWTPNTTTPPASQLAAAMSSCQSSYTAGVHILPPNKQLPIPPSLPPLVLSDSRGPFEMLVYAGPSGEGECLWDSSGVITVGGGNGGTLPPTSEDSIGIPGVGFARNRESVLTYATGHAGTRVTAVTLDLANGVRVKATVQNGFYAAWWPSRTDVIATEVTASDGVHHQGVGDIGPNDNGPGSSGIGS